jgi:ATP-binding cassette subfamily B protein
MARAPRALVEPGTSLGPLRMIFSAASRYPGKVALALAALVITAAATLAIPSGFKLIIDRGFAAGTDPAEIGRWFRYLFMIVVVLAMGTASRFYFVSWLGERVVADIRLAVQRNLLRLSPGFFEENAPSEISSRMTSDTAQIEHVVGTTISVALRNALMAVGGIGYLLYLAPTLTGMLLLGVPVVLVPIVWFGRRLRKISRESQDRVATVGSRVAEVLGAMKIVQGFNQEWREQERFGAAVENAFDTARRRIRLRAAMTGLVISLIFGAITLLLWRGAIQVAEGTLSGGTIAAFVLTGVMVAGAMGSLTEVYGDLLRGDSRFPSRRAAGSPSRTSPSATRPGPRYRRSASSA